MKREQSIADKVARKIVADSGDVDLSFNVQSFFAPIEGRMFTRQQQNIAETVLSKVLDWNRDSIYRLIKKEIKSYPSMVKGADEVGLRIL